MGVRRYTEVIPAGTVDKVFRWGGSFLFIEDLTGPFNFKTVGPTGESDLYAARTRLKVRDVFREIRVSNPGDEDVTVTFYIGGAEVDFTDVVLPPTKAETASFVVGALDIANGVIVTGVNADGKRRKQIVVFNDSLTLPVYVMLGDVAVFDNSKTFGVVPAQTSWTFETDASLKLFPLDLGTLVAVGQTFYR